MDAQEQQGKASGSACKGRGKLRYEKVNTPIQNGELVIDQNDGQHWSGTFTPDDMQGFIEALKAMPSESGAPEFVAELSQAWGEVDGQVRLEEGRWRNCVVSTRENPMTVSGKGKSPCDS